MLYPFQQQFRDPSTVRPLMRKLISTTIISSFALVAAAGAVNADDLDAWAAVAVPLL